MRYLLRTTDETRVSLHDQLRDEHDEPAFAAGAHSVAQQHRGEHAIASLQSTAGNRAVATTLQREQEQRSPVHDVIASPGRSLDTHLRVQLEQNLGADLSGVRVHDTAAAQASAQSVSARAYTVGDNIVLGSGVNSALDEGKRTLAHEAVHVLQQRAGPVDGTPAPGGIRISDPADRFERQADQIASSIAPRSGSNDELSEE